MTERLEEDEINERLEDLKIWSTKVDKLVTRIEFENYREACFFTNTVFSLAEKESHYPEIKVKENAVEIDLWTEETEGLTEKDFQMAEKIEESVGEIEWS
jgi:4a-hydroxytetrahydrobiopterin dehydratase